ncbi:MAG: thiolase family protein [Deltaproteobacteria bacterium]|nr:thiolase family protein [Deltaproteobacteria bacterium]MBW2339376.1 thiolase family protein [Deltaproteobacteria bacterium]
MEDREIVIVSGCRTAMTNYGSHFTNVPLYRLSATVIEEALKRAGLQPDHLEYVFFGHVMTDSTSPNVGRLSLLHAGVPVTTPATTLDHQCGSGLEAINHCARKIKLKEGDIMIGGGVEIMSAAPYMNYDVRWGKRAGDAMFIDYFGTLARTVSTDIWGNFTMANTSDHLAHKYNITREDQDAFASLSNRRALAAIKAGKFKDQIVPVEVPQRKGGQIIVDTDEHPRDSSPEVLGKLPAPFPPALGVEKSMVTAGNASGINDAAAAVVVMSRERADELGIKPLVKIKSWGLAGVHPNIMGWGPVPATEKALKAAGLTFDDLDLIELNEAFAGQALAVIRHWGYDRYIDRINVNGGAIALGHPVGATGTIIMIKLIYEMLDRDARYGMATICCGGGLGVSTIVERV